jgi:CubicO group peptidase (beta-lactamase class C family)
MQEIHTGREEPVPMVSVTADPTDLGFDPDRLARIDRHFARYVEAGQLAGWQIVVTRRGQVVHASTHGVRDLASGAPVEPDTLWRIYSMTKPVTSVAAMSLWEEGRFQLTDEVSRYIPEFADVRVYQKGAVTGPVTVPAVEPMRIWHLLTHTAGLTYGFQYRSVVDALYRKAGFEYIPQELELATAIPQVARLPLLFQPGSAFGYSMATDVLGRVLEVVAGQPLDEVLAQRVLGPLKMADTTWWVAPDRADRLATLYSPRPGGELVRNDLLGVHTLARPAFLAGGSGLVSTAADYHRFTQLLLRGGEYDGARVLGSRTLRYMTRNHLPGGLDLTQLSTGDFSDTVVDGTGFGLGFAVVGDPVPLKTLCSPGEYYWGGLASTAFLVDPAEELTAMLFTQLVPSSTYPLRAQLRQLIYSALVD